MMTRRSFLPAAAAIAAAAQENPPVERKGRSVGILRDVLVATDGGLAAVVVESDDLPKRVPFDGELRFAPERRSAA